MGFQLPFIGKKSNKMLGLDIGSSSVKILELAQVGNNYQVESYAAVPIPSHAIIENDLKNITLVAEAIATAHKQSQSTLKLVAAAVPTSSVINKILPMDADMSAQEMAEQIPLEAARYVPYPLEEVALDFTVLGNNEKEPGKLDVLIVAARHEQIQSRTEAIHLAGLIPKIMDVESYAIERVCHFIVEQLPNKGKNQIIAVIDIGAVLTTMTILHDLRTIYHRDEVFGGRQLTEAIQIKYNLSDETAELMKKQDSLRDDYVSEVLAPFREMLISLIHRSLQLFFSASRFTEVDHILLAGGGAMINGISALIQEYLSTPCTVVNPFINMSLNHKVSTSVIAADSSGLVTCCGLALRGVKNDLH